MDEESERPKDLFGDPWTPPRDPRGRKRHARRAEIAEKVAVLKATGSTDEQIALRIGLSVPTLKKYYFRELESGADLARQVLVETMWGKALDGNVSAAKFIRDELPKGAAAKFAQSQRERRSPPPGKKEMRAQAAETAGDGSAWGDDLKVTH